MIKTTFLLPVLLVLFGCNASKSNQSSAADNTLSAREKKEGWQLLFNGHTTEGWHTYGKTSAGAGWKADGGALHIDVSLKDGRGDLVTDREYENFDLKLDWKIAEKGNSGIIFYVDEDAAKYEDTYETGMEMQVLDNGAPTRQGHPDGKYYTHRAGDLYDLLASKEAARPLGEWNSVEIKCHNGNLDFYMNGEHTLSTTLWNDEWKKMIAISKFRSMPGFGIFRKGRIALQDHGDQVWYKNIRIKKL